MYQEQAPDEEKPAVRWLPFQLNPDLPEEGISRKEYIERKFGPGGSRNYSRVAGVGKEVGIDFAFDDITVQPNTVNAHRLMLYGAKHGREDEVAESLFRAYFQEGAVLTDKASAGAIGERAGLASDRHSTPISRPTRIEDAIVRGDIDAPREASTACRSLSSITHAAVSGAHEPETLLKAMMDSLRV